MSDAKPSIFIITKDKYPAFRVDITELYLRYLVKNYRLTFLMDRDEEGRQAPEEVPDIDYVLPQHNAKRWLRTIRLHIAGIKRIWHDRPDIIQCRDTMIMALPYLLLAMLIKRPFVYWMSYPMELSNFHRAKHYLARGSLFKALLQFGYGSLGLIILYGIVLRLSRHIFVQSDQMKKDVKALGINPTKITPVPMGVNLELFNSDVIESANDSIYEGRQSIFYSGTLDIARRMDIPTEGVARFIARNKDMIFVIAGKASQSERHLVRNAMRNHGVESQLVFLEHMPLKKMLSHVKRASLCLAPYSIDSKMLRSATPTKLVEYLAMGKRVVANAHPDQVFVLSHTGLGIITDFSAEGFEQGLESSITQGNPSAEETLRAKKWIETNRSYSVLSRVVDGAYSAYCGLGEYK